MCADIIVRLGPPCGMRRTAIIGRWDTTGTTTRRDIGTRRAVATRRRTAAITVRTTTSLADMEKVITVRMTTSLADMEKGTIAIATGMTDVAMAPIAATMRAASHRYRLEPTRAVAHERHHNALGRVRALHRASGRLGLRV